MAVSALVFKKADSTVLRPIVAMTVVCESGARIVTYGLLDTGTNKSGVLKSFTEKHGIDTSKAYMRLDTLNSTFASTAHTVSCH